MNTNFTRNRSSLLQCYEREVIYSDGVIYMSSLRPRDAAHYFWREIMVIYPYHGRPIDVSLHGRGDANLHHPIFWVNLHRN